MNGMLLAHLKCRAQQKRHRPPSEKTTGLSSETALCQVKLLITNNAFCFVQRATAQPKTDIVRDYGVAKATPGFQAGWSNCMYFFSLFLFILFAHLEFPFKFLYS
jgi:hypothetical protein